MNHKERKSRPIRTAGSNNSDCVVTSELIRPATKVKQKAESYFKPAAPGTLLPPVDVQARQANIDYKINQAALQAFAERGLVAPDVIVRTGCGKVWERCKTIDKPHHQNGAYSAYPDYPFTILLENHADGQGVTRWVCHKDIHVTPDILAAMRARDTENKIICDQKAAADSATAQQRAWRFLRSCKPCTKHPYTSSKGFPKLAENLRLLQKDGWLVIVLFGEDGKATGGYQRIKWGVNPEEEGFVKLFAKGIAQAGTYAIIPPDNGIVKHIVVCEGFCTGLSIHTAFPDYLIYCAMDAGNLVATAQIANRKYHTVSITIAADNDSNKVGINAALSAQKAVDAPAAAIAIPSLVGADWNDIHVEDGLAAMREQFETRNNDYPPRVRIFNSIDGVNNSEDKPVFDEDFYNMGDFEVLSKTPPKKDIQDADKKQHPENAAATNGGHTEAERNKMENPQPDANNTSGTASGSKPGQKGIAKIDTPAAAAPGTAKPDGTSPGGEQLAANSGKQAEQSATPEHEDWQRLRDEWQRIASVVKGSKSEADADSLHKDALGNIGRIVHAGNISRADAESGVWLAFETAEYAHGEKSEEIKKYIDSGISAANADPSLKTWGVHTDGYIDIGKSQAEVDALAAEKLKKQEAGQVPHEGTNRSTGLIVVTGDDFMTETMKPREMLLAPVLPERGIIELHAYRGVGKTFFAMHFACAVAGGGLVFDRWNAHRPAKVLYIDGEMAQVDFQARYSAIAPIYNIPRGNFRIITPEKQDAAMPNLATKEGHAAVNRVIEDAELIVIDNLACLCRNTKTNDAESWLMMQDWLLDCRKQGVSTLFLHHDGKDGKQRGTSAKEDIVDTVIGLKRPGDYENSQMARFVVNIEKGRGITGNDGDPFECQLVSRDGILAWDTKPIEESLLEQVAALDSEGFKGKDIAQHLGISAVKVTRLKKKLESGIPKWGKKIHPPKRGIIPTIL